MRLLVLLLLLSLINFCSAAEEEVFNVIDWQIETLNETLSGRAVFVFDEVDCFRVEFVTNENDSFEAMLSHKGVGWTITPALNDTIVLQPWVGTFKKIDHSYSSIVITLLKLLNNTFNDQQVDYQPHATKLSDELTGDHNKFVLSMKNSLFYKDSLPELPGELLDKMRKRAAGRAEASEKWVVQTYLLTEPIIEIESNRTPALLTVKYVGSFTESMELDDLLVPFWSLDSLGIEANKKWN